MIFCLVLTHDRDTSPLSCGTGSVFCCHRDVRLLPRSRCPAAKPQTLQEGEQEQAENPVIVTHKHFCINKPPASPPPPSPSSTAPRPTTARPHSHAPLGRPALECRSWGRISLQALNMSHVSPRRGADRGGERWDRYAVVPLQGSGRFAPHAGLCDRFPD